MTSKKQYNRASFVNRIGYNGQIMPVLRWNSKDVAATIHVESGFFAASEGMDRELPMEQITDVFGDDGTKWWTKPMSDKSFRNLIQVTIVENSSGTPIEDDTEEREAEAARIEGEYAEYLKRSKASWQI